MFDFIETAIFCGKDRKVFSDKETRELLDFLDLPMIDDSEYYVAYDIKLTYEGRVRQVHIEITEAIKCGLEFVCGYFEEYEEHVGYDIFMSNVTNYDEDDGLDKFDPIF